MSASPDAPTTSDKAPGAEEAVQVLPIHVLHRWIALDKRYSQGEEKPWRSITNADDRRENEEVVRMMSEAAEQGHAGSQSQLGSMYMMGWGVPQSDATSVEWSRKGADQGNAQGQTNLGTMFIDGRGGLPQSERLAVEWYRKAADQGYAKAEYNLGYMHEQGELVPQSNALAVGWYRKAADKGYAPAQFNLGLMFANGQGVPQSFHEALQWLYKARAQGAEQDGLIDELLQAQARRGQQTAEPPPPAPASQGSA